MRVEFYHHDVPLDTTLQRIIDRRIEKLEKRLKRYHPDAAHLVIRLTWEPSRELYHVTLELRVFHRDLAVKKEGHHLAPIIRSAFEALMKEFEKYRLQINKSLRAKRMAKQALKVGEVAPQIAAKPLILREAIEKNMQKLYRLARHEVLNYQLSGVLEPGEISPQEIVDEAVIRVAERLDERATLQTAEQRLMRQVLAVAKEFVRQAETTPEEISLELPLEEIPDPEEVTTLGEEILYFYEPDEALKLEDVTEDPSAITPEEVVENEELQKLLFSLLSQLPDTARQIFTLVNIEGLSVEETAMVLGKPPAQVKQILHNAEEVLRSKLSTEGEPMAVEQLRRIYAEMRVLAVDVRFEERYRNLLRE